MLPRLNSNDVTAVKSDGKFTVAILPASLIEIYWPMIRVQLEKDPSLWERAHTTESLRYQLEMGDLICWLVSSSEGLVYLIFFSHIVEYPNAKVMNIVWAQGTDIKKYITLGLLGVEEYSSRIGCNYVAVDAHRQGWAKLLAPFQYQPLQTTFVKSIVTERMN